MQKIANYFAKYSMSVMRLPNFVHMCHYYCHTVCITVHTDSLLDEYLQYSSVSVRLKVYVFPVLGMFYETNFESL